MKKGRVLMNKRINTFVIMLFIATLCAMGARFYDNTVFRWASYIIECFLIVYTLLSSKNSSSINIDYKSLVFISFILIINYLLSPYEVNYTDLLKLFGYFCCYKYGDYLAKHYHSLSVSKVILYSFILIPVIIVVLFDDTIAKDAFFVTSNIFVYTGLSMGVLYLLVNYGERKHFWIAWAVVAFYILICSSLGVVVAIVISYMILNLKKKNIPYLLVGGGLVFIAIMYVDLPVFIRFRDVINVWGSMSKSDWANLNDLNLYEISQQSERVGERTDTNSSLWRLVHWYELLAEHLKSIWKIPFGSGAGFSIGLTELLPHNDFLLILVEYGLVVFCFFIKLIVTVYKRMVNERMLIYFILAMFCYHMTENLMLTFPPNALLYFVVGWSMCRFKPSFKQVGTESLSNVER